MVPSRSKISSTSVFKVERPGESTQDIAIQCEIRRDARSRGSYGNDGGFDAGIRSGNVSYRIDDSRHGGAAGQGIVNDQYIGRSTELAYAMRNRCHFFLQRNKAAPSSELYLREHNMLYNAQKSSDIGRQFTQHGFE